MKLQILWPKKKELNLDIFGAFSVQERRARIGRNPRSGESVSVEAKSIPRFKTGKELRMKLNARQTETETETN